MKQSGKGNPADPENMEKLDSKVIPVMREGITIVQMILFRQLKEALAGKYNNLGSDEFGRFVGAIVNDIFGTPAQEPESLEFCREHFEAIDEELRCLADTVPDLLAPLTDALRMQTLCDNEEGTNTLPTLLRARALGVLQEERPLPVPSTFMILARRLGATHSLLEPMQVNQPPSEQQG